MRLYHTTDAAEAILRDGFRDGEGTYGFGMILRGVFLAIAPADVNDGAYGDQVLAVDLPDGFDLSEYAIIEDGPFAEYLRARGWSAWEWCVPAGVINRHGRVRLLTEDEADAAKRERWGGVPDA